MEKALLAVAALLVVKFCVVAFWMQDQRYQRAARINLLAAMLTLAGGFVFALGLQAVACAAALVAVVLGISSLRLVRIGRG